MLFHMLQNFFPKFIFLSCLGIVIVSFTSLIFPALLIEITNDINPRDVNLFELGALAIPIIVSNIAFVGLYFLYKKKKLPQKIAKNIDYVFNNDISKKTTVIIVSLLFLMYIIFTIDELNREEYELEDYVGVIDAAKNFEFPKTLSVSAHPRYFLLHVSYVIFDNIRVLPYIASISLLAITFFLTLEITKKRLPALLAFSVVLQSNLFLIFDTTATYENFWTAFYFFSLYLIIRKSKFSAVSFVLSMMTKPLTIAYLPVNIFAILNKKSSKRDKIILLISYGIIILIILVAFLTSNLSHVSNVDFDASRLISSFNEMGNSLRLDSLILLLMIPMLIILANKKGEIRNQINFIFFGIAVVILSQPIMYSLIEMTLQPYRFIPLIVFSAIGIGMCLSSSSREDQE